jgi:hypothetical protein
MDVLLVTSSHMALTNLDYKKLIELGCLIDFAYKINNLSLKSK